MRNVHIVQENLYFAAPSAGLTDIIPIPSTEPTALENTKLLRLDTNGYVEKADRHGVTLLQANQNSYSRTLFICLFRSSANAERTKGLRRLAVKP